MPTAQDGPASPLFEPAPIKGNPTTRDLTEAPVARTMRHHGMHAPSGRCTGQGIPFAIQVCLLICLAVAAFGCRLTAITGDVVDTDGRPVPGVAVTLDNSRDQAVTNALGEYQIANPPGSALLRFTKTGYAPAEVHLPDVAGDDSRDLEPVTMWRLPVNQGVHLDERDRFIALEPVEPERLFLQGGGSGLGAKRPPDVATQNPSPAIVAFKMPRDGARLSRLVPRQAALGDAGSQVHHIEAWVAEESEPVDLRPLDEPEQLLRQVRLPAPLEPGVYAVHWGALDGYITIDTRMFYFRVDAPAPPEPLPEEASAAGEQPEAAPEE